MKIPTTPVEAADDAWSALQELTSHLDVCALAGAADALALARGLVAPRSFPRRRRSSLSHRVGPGALVEIERDSSVGPPTLSPTWSDSSGSFKHADVREYRVLARGRIGGRNLETGASLVVARRPPEAGDWIVVVDRRGIRPVVAGPRGAIARGPEGILGEGRVLGVVEAVLAGGRGS